MISPKAIEPIIVRTINADDRQIWEPLWNGYLEFYGKHISQRTTDLTWHRLTRSGDIHGLIALSRRGEAVGLVHFLSSIYVDHRRQLLRPGFVRFRLRPEVWGWSRTDAGRRRCGA